jgi:hypothetical protein
MVISEINEKKQLDWKNSQPYRSEKVNGENVKEHDISGEHLQPHTTTCKTQ